MASATMPASRWPSVIQISTETESIAIIMCNSSSFDFSAAVSP